MDGINHLSKSPPVETNAKQKRQLAWSPIVRRRKKQNRGYNYYDNENDNDSDESESEEDDADHNAHYTHNRDRLEDTNDQPYPFWDTYDTLNQYYLEIGKHFLKLVSFIELQILFYLFFLVLGNRLDMKNHYRGHKLSLWLNLIPQLHMPGELNELSIRHHHFSESDAKFYDGIVRVQNIEKPVYIKPITIKSEIPVAPTKPMIATPATLTGN